MTLYDRKQRLLQQRLGDAGLHNAKPSVAPDRPRREERDGPAILSSAQRRMWYLAQLAEGSAAYNFCVVLRAESAGSDRPLSEVAMTDALAQVVQRHEILRTRYRAGANGTPEQIVAPHLEPRITVTELPAASRANVKAFNENLDLLARQARDEPFDLETDAPLRAIFVRSEENIVAVILVLPHIAGDGGSFGTVLTDLEHAYERDGGTMPSTPSEIRYTDYAIWEQRRLGDRADPQSLHAEQLRFWEDQLAGLPVELSLPFDRPRPTEPSFAGRQIRRWLGHGLSRSLRDAVKARGASPLVALQSAVAVALARAGAGQDIPLGMPVDLRQDGRLDQLVGFFSNTVVVRADLARDPTFSELLRHLHDTGLAAIDNRDVPFENVVEHLNPPRIAARNPLFGAMVTATRPWPSLEFGGTRFSLDEPRQTQAKFDLTFVIHDEGAGGRIGISLLYACDLFDGGTAEHLLELVIGILGQGVHHPQLRLSQFAESTHRHLEEPAANLAAILAAQDEAAQPTRRAIHLAPDVKEADIVAALAGLLERHDALRLRRDPESGGWALADAAALLDAPILWDAPPPEEVASGCFLAWLRTDDGARTDGARPVLELSAPGRFVDDESWGVLLAELAGIRLGGGTTPPPAVGGYADWLDRTADLATAEEILDRAEAWLDVYDAAQARAPIAAPAGQYHVVEREVAFPALGTWPDPAALRTAALAGLLWSQRRASAPLLVQIDEPDRDRTRAGTFDSVVGRCRRTFPCLAVPPAAVSTGYGAAQPADPESLLRAARRALAPDGAEDVTGELTVSYLLARDVSPDTAGAFDHVPAPDMVLSISATDPGDAEDVRPAAPGGHTPEGEHWAIRVTPRSQSATLTIRARRSAAELDALAADWSAMLPDLVAAAMPAGGGSVQTEDRALIELSSWDRRRLEDSFGPIREVLPLSPLQEGLRFHAVGASEGMQDVYISQTSLDLRGEIDPARLHRAVQKAVELTPSVAAGFAEVAGTMMQTVPASIDIPWRHEEVTDRDQAARVADEEYHATFDAARPPLIRFALVQLPAVGGARTHRLFLTAHHILLDGWSIRLLFRLIFRLYDAPEAVPAPPPFRRYLSWLAAQDRAGAEETWQDVLSGVEPTLLYPGARGLEASAERSEERIATVGPELTAPLGELAHSASTTLSTVLELAWGTLLIRLSGAPDVVFGNVVSGRPAEIENVNEIIGLLFNTVPARVRARGGESIRAVLGALHRQKAATLRHSQVDLSRLQQISGHNPLFDTLFAVQNLPALEESGARGIQLGEAHVRDATHYPLSMAVSPAKDAISLRLMFRNDVVAPEQAEALIQAYIGIFEEFVRDPDQPLLRVDALPAPNPLLPRSVAGEALEIGTRSVADLLVDQAAATPDARAVVSGDTQLTFAELAAAAHRLAHLLQSRGVQPEHRVALLLPRSELMIVALFGVFAAHAAYVPVDPETPAKRIQSILSQSDPTVILTSRDLKTRLPETYGADDRVVVLDDAATQAALLEQPAAAPPTKRPAGLRHLAYIIFTSGSTGEPKGVAVPYLGLTNMFVNHRKEIFAPTLAAQGGRRLRIAHTTSFAFDASWEQLLWLLSGHEVHVISDELRRDPDRLLPLFDREEIDAFDVTPTYGAYLVEHGLLDRDRAQGRSGTGVVFVSLGGEAVGDALWTRLREAPGVGGYNLYGPTEYTINALGADLADSAEPSVGRPISNTCAYILGPGLLPAPVGVTGELYLGGVGLARGYAGRPGGTAERFIANPFGDPGSRLYRTGDLARWRPDGSIDFLRRADNQLKIRGYRIEPAEVENAIVAKPGISRAAVLGRPTQDGSLRLVAYVVCDQQAACVEQLREQLRTDLPSYMVPAAIVLVDDLPRTINGKLDVAALPEPGVGGAEITSPLNDTEHAICNVFASALELDAVGRLDDFFESGGHSLLTVRLVSQLRDTLGADISVRQIYDHPTPAALAAALGMGSGAADVETGSGDSVGSGVIERMRADTVLPTDLALSGTAAPRPRPELAALETVLLTGAAGFLGSYVLAELLRNTTAQIHCLVRAKDETSAVDRVRKALISYGLWETSFAPRLADLPGDLSLPRFGLTGAAFAALMDRFDVIVHNGGATNEAEPYERLAPTNVGGAREILRLATGGRCKTPVHFVSTASVVARRGRNPAVIGEETRLAAHEVEPTGYVQSKWVAEELMHAAAGEGAPITIHRPGRVSGHSVTGACGRGVGFWYFIRSMLQLGAAPALHSDRLTLAPVDHVARAMVALIERGEAGETYHLSNRTQTSIGAILEAARRAGYVLDTMPFDTWRERLTRAAETRAEQGDDSLAPVVLLSAHIEKYDGPDVESALGQERVEAALAGSGIAPPPVTAAVLDRYIAYFIETGFFPPPEACGT